jgi:hypothetical protein
MWGLLLNLTKLEGLSCFDLLFKLRMDEMLSRVFFDSVEGMIFSYWLGWFYLFVSEFIRFLIGAVEPLRLIIRFG